MTLILPASYTLTTARCLLQRVREEERVHVLDASRYEGFHDGMLWEPPQTAEELRLPYENALKAWEDGSAYSFSILDRLNHYDFIGRIALRRDPTSDDWNIGFWTHPERQGQGLMTEAVAALVDLAFGTLDANRIDADHALWNKASRRVLEKNGLKFLEHLPQGFMKRGAWVAEDRLRLSRAEWEARR